MDSINLYFDVYDRFYVLVTPGYNEPNESWNFL